MRPLNWESSARPQLLDKSTLAPCSAASLREWRAGVVGGAERLRSATGGGVSGFTLAGGEPLHSHHASPSEEKASASSPQTTQEASSGFSSPRMGARSERRHNPCAPTVSGVSTGFPPEVGRNASNPRAPTVVP